MARKYGLGKYGLKSYDLGSSEGFSLAGNVSIVLHATSDQIDYDTGFISSLTIRINVNSLRVFTGEDWDPIPPVPDRWAPAIW